MRRTKANLFSRAAVMEPLKEGEMGRLFSAIDRQVLRVVRGPAAWDMATLRRATGVSELALTLACDRLERLGLLQGLDL